MFLCGLLSFLIPETNGKTLAEIEGDEMYGNGSSGNGNKKTQGRGEAVGVASSGSSLEKVEECGVAPKLGV